MRASTAALALPLLCLAGAAGAHGINGHVHVTGWAIERLPPGEIADFFADPELFDAALFGASFPDSGYAAGDPYGEMAHWPPFLEAYLRHLVAEIGPPFDTQEKRRQAAFVIGLACHGLQDEIFDSIFLHHIGEHDGQGQEQADSGTDAMLYTDGYLRYKPPMWAPLDDLIAVFAAEGHAVDRETIEGGMFRVKTLVIDRFELLAPTFDRELRPLLPWTAAHYLDPAVPGSLAAEIPATGAFIEALWDRMHGRFPVAALVGHPYPDGRRRLMSRDPASVGSWVTLVLGIGARIGSVSAETVHLEGPDGPVPFELDHTRWSGAPDDWTRIVQLRPRVELAPDAQYTVRLSPGIELIDGRVLDEPWVHVFQTPCGEGMEGDCPPEPADGGVLPVDAAVPDAMVEDAMPDAMVQDAMPDVAVPDAIMPDAIAPDATAPTASGGAGDGCGAAPGRSGPWGALWLALAALGISRARRWGARPAAGCAAGAGRTPTADAGSVAAPRRSAPGLRGR